MICGVLSRLAIASIAASCRSLAESGRDHRAADLSWGREALGSRLLGEGVRAGREVLGCCFADLRHSTIDGSICSAERRSIRSLIVMIT
jgi:hypothetical protein